MRTAGIVPVLLAAGLALATAGIGGATPLAPAAPVKKANLWIDTSGGSCARQSAPERHVDARACATLQAAFDAARPGDVVNIADGIYKSQALVGSKRVLFRAAGPGRPRFGQIVSAASGITVSGIQIENRDHFDGPCSDPDNAILYPCGPNQTFDNVVVDGLNLRLAHGIRGVGNGFVLENSEVRNIHDYKAFEGGSDDMVIANNYWHDIKVVTDGVHNECMYVDGGNRAVFRGNRFIGCPTMALYFTNWNGGPPYRDVLIENNVFGHTLTEDGQWHGSCALVLGSGANFQNSFVGWVVRYNTFESCVGRPFSPPGVAAGVAQWYGNLGTVGGCVPQFVYRYNVGETCGGVGDVEVKPAINDARHQNQAPFYVNAPKNDFRLRAGAAALNRGDPSAYPSVDKAGAKRMIGSAPDAGAYERVAGATTGVLALGGLDVGSSQRRAAAAMRKFERGNPADVFVALGGNDPTHGRAFAQSWQGAFGWLRSAGVGVAGVLGRSDVAVRGGRYQFGALRMPAPYYLRRIGDAELIVLNSNAVTRAQTRWLQRTLARSTPRFRIVALHEPPFTCSGALGSARVRSEWVPLFERYGVRLVLSGGGAGYERFSKSGVTYIVDGGRARAGRCPTSYPQRQAAIRANGFVYVTVDAGGVLARAVSVAGKVTEAVRIS